jgi:hypothetical protein
VETRVLRILCCEVEQQCIFAITAVNDLKQALSMLDVTRVTRVWYSVQAFLVAVGNLSKLLWGCDGQRCEQRAELRNMLSVDEGSPLESRTFRNHFEHFDERIEKWAESSRRGNFYDSNIGPLTMFPDVEPSDCLRHFDPQDFKLFFRGDEYEFGPVVDAVYDLHQNTVDILQLPTSPR